MHTFRTRRTVKPRRRFSGRWVILGILLVYCMSVLLWPLSDTTPVTAAPVSTPANAVTLPWPSYGQSSIGAEGYGVLERHNDNSPAAMASITKIVTALVVLDAKPIANTNQSPVITLTAADAALYDQYLAAGGSVVPADAGMTISQYDALRALLIASANNYADTLAIWSYGSLDAYQAAATAYIQEQGLTQTTVVDTNGFSPANISTSSDLVKLGLLALDNPIIRDIVGQQTARIPDIGVLSTTNILLGVNGVIGIKTGTTDEAGSCLLYASKQIIDGKPITIVGASLGAPSHTILARDLDTLITSATAGFRRVQLAKNGQSLATYSPPWSTPVHAVATENIDLIVWSDTPIKTAIQADTVAAGTAKNTLVGSANFSAGTTQTTIELKLVEQLPTPSWWWRLTHPHKIFV